MKNSRIQMMMQIAGSNSGQDRNKAILSTWKSTTGATTFKSAQDWRKQGKFIRKGEKGYPVFSQPTRVNEKGNPVYTIGFLFHEGQLK